MPITGQSPICNDLSTVFFIIVNRTSYTHQLLSFFPLPKAAAKGGAGYMHKNMVQRTKRHKSCSMNCVASYTLSQRNILRHSYHTCQTMYFKIDKNTTDMTSKGVGRRGIAHIFFLLQQAHTFCRIDMHFISGGLPLDATHM